MTLYPTIVADPPWPLKWRGGTSRKNGRGETYRPRVATVNALPYRTMSVDAIAALDVGALAAPDAHLYLWIPDAFLIEGVGARVVRGWGFEPGRVLLFWAKRGYGLGTFPRAQHEAVICCRRGDLAWRVRDVGSVQDWKLPYSDGSREHSRKPDGFLDLVERASPGPYLELFARRQRIGWDTWGDQATDHVQLDSTEARLSADPANDQEASCPAVASDARS